MTKLKILPYNPKLKTLARQLRNNSTHDYHYDYDERRQKKLENLGIVFVRFSDHDVKRCMNNVLRALENTIVKLEKRER